MPAALHGDDAEHHRSPSMFTSCGDDATAAPQFKGYTPPQRWSRETLVVGGALDSQARACRPCCTRSTQTTCIRACTFGRVYWYSTGSAGRSGPQQRNYFQSWHSVAKKRSRPFSTSNLGAPPPRRWLATNTLPTQIYNYGTQNSI